MNNEKALKLMDILYEVKRLTILLQPLIESGSEELNAFSQKLFSLLDEVFPTFTLAVTGPVGSGKSTILTSLLMDDPVHPIASIGPSNETFVPMILSHGETPSLMAKYFSVNVLHEIEGHIKSISKKGENREILAQYNDLRSKLGQFREILAGEGEKGVVKRVSLKGLSQKEIAKAVRNYTALSSEKAEVYGIYKVEVAYPGKILRDFRNARFVDLYGFGEPSPIVSMKLSRFLDEEEAVDVIIYVFPDRAVTDDFYTLFDSDFFSEDTVKNGKLILILNKADSYPNVRPADWEDEIRAFRKTLQRHVPSIRHFAEKIPIFIMSGAAIDGTIQHTYYKEIREKSRKSIKKLREMVGGISRSIDLTARDLTMNLGQIFDLLEVLDALVYGVEKNLNTLEEKIPTLSFLVDNITREHSEFEAQRVARFHGLKEALKTELKKEIREIDLEQYGAIDTTGVPIGDPIRLFQWMIDRALIIGENIFSKEILPILGKVSVFIDRTLLAAYREYVKKQDEQNVSEILSFSDGKREIKFSPLSSTVEAAAREMIGFSKQNNLYIGAREIFKRFLMRYFRERCTFESGRGQKISDVIDSILLNVSNGIEIFSYAFIIEDESKTSHLKEILVAGETSFWTKIFKHIERMDVVLAEQIKITKWKIGLFQNKTFLVSQKPQYQSAAKELINCKKTAQELILELL